MENQLQLIDMQTYFMKEIEKSAEKGNLSAIKKYVDVLNEGYDIKKSKLLL